MVIYNTKYPCKFSDIDFTNLKEFGYSSHFPYLITPLTASILGSEIIEIHVHHIKQKIMLITM